MESAKVPARSVGIVGGGVSGVIHADVLSRLGFTPVVVFEQHARVGGVWHVTPYDGLTAQNTKLEYRAPDFDWPAPGPAELHPTRDQILGYLDAFVAARRLDVRTRHRVRSAKRPQGARGPWVLVVESPSGVHQLQFDFLVIASGLFSHRPDVPAHTAKKDVRRIVSPQDVKSSSEFKDKDVVVVGFGKSALDMLTAACLAPAKSITHVFRKPRAVVPKYVLGIHLTYLIFPRYFTMFAAKRAPAGRSSTHLFQIAKWAFMEFALRRICIWSLKASEFKDARAWERLNLVLPKKKHILSGTPCMEPDGGYFKFVVNGTIEPLVGSFVGFSDTGACRIMDESDPTHTIGDIHCDVLCLCTGQAGRSAAFPFLEPELREKLEGSPDGCQLYRHVLHPDVPTLGFAGFNTGALHYCHAQLGALFLGSVWRGDMQLPSSADMSANCAALHQWKRDNIGFDTYRANTVHLQYQYYLDVMCEELGLAPFRKPTAWKEFREPYGAADYAGTVEEYLRHVARLPQPGLRSSADVRI